MLDVITKCDIALFVIFLLEGCSIQWLLPLGESPTGTRKQRIARYLLPLFALLCVSLFVLPPDTNPLFLIREELVVVLTPACVGLPAYTAVLVWRALRWRMATLRK